MILGVVLLSGCGTLGAGSAGEGDSGDGGAGAGSSSEDETSGDEEDGALDEIDLSMSCPDDPVIFQVFLDYQLNAEEDDGYIYERTDPSVGVPVEIHGSQVLDLEPADIQGVRIPVTIEGVSGDCTITGMAEISLQIGGTCHSGIATLDIQGTYEIYHRSINCPGQPPVEFTDSLFPGPSVTADFNISSSGDTFDWSQDAGQMQFIYKWTLRPMIGIIPIEE
jgi:hypothetical protein